ncbi:MAG TPA: tRNA 2-selenouridine(34) synthase MnmH [Desulfitobacteriaceae bacterium]|nr:tRNA 2-selenouridine(34) synthase MnmH [Desulfitobacteriaceae bacterium]
MIREIRIEELFVFKKAILVDVRSEGEYSEATIPGALNLPLFNNYERAEVGKAYTQISPFAARKIGLNFISPKLPSLVERALKLAESGQLVVFCWRGGLRSKALAAILDLMGVPVYRLQGGYKAYRAKVLEFFQAEPAFKIIVLCGNTGVGKTEFLASLRREGYPVIDLEKLANNRGSVFGSMGLGDPPSQKAFEGMLYEELKSLAGFNYLIVECESKRIGKVTLPLSFYRAMQNGTRVLLFDSIPNRIARLVKEYSSVPNILTETDKALERLLKTLGRSKVHDLKELIRQENYPEFTEKLLLEYYDIYYAYPNEASDKYRLCLNQEDKEVLKQLKQMKEFLAEWSAR